MSTVKPNHNRILFQGTRDDVPFLPLLKPLLGNISAAVNINPISTLSEVILNTKAQNATAIISTSPDLLKRLVVSDSSPSIDNYSGSLFTRSGIEILFIDPLAHIRTVPHGKFLTNRFISKFTKPSSWYELPKFEWEVASTACFDKYAAFAANSIAIAIDIETWKGSAEQDVPPSIRCIGYTFILSPTDFRTVVIPFNSMENYTLVRNLNASPAPKIFQNGKYDNFYLLAYNCPVTNWLFDTQHFFHAAYSELPKDLGFLQSFYIRDSQYWKDLADTTDLHTYYEYNARDCHGTAATWMVQLLTAKPHELTNYLKEFPLVYPCLVTELTGMRRDVEALQRARKDIISKRDADQDFLNRCLGGTFNTNSPVQVKQLLSVLGIKNADSSDEKALKKYGYMHPLNSLLLEKVLDIRGYRKLISTYLTDGTDTNSKNKVASAKEFRGRILYSILPHGTDTFRSASRESAFWCGFNIQNIPRDRSVKQTIVADDGFLFGECDYSKAESFGTAYTSGDANLLSAVKSTQDFHSSNASKFFGLPYSSIYDDAMKRVLNKPIRQVSKNTNHGANYLMGPDVMVDTMGMKAVMETKRLLNLPKGWMPRQVCEYLLEQFHKTYPGLRAIFYPAITKEVTDTGKLVSALGWTRITFKKPTLNKRDLNALVAHVPQNLNAEVLNDAYLAVFHEIWLVHSSTFKLGPPIHDSIQFQFRIGYEHHATRVKEIMERCSRRSIKAYDGVTREMFVPAELKQFGTHWSDLSD